MVEATTHGPLLRVTLSGPAAETGQLRLDVLLEVGQGLQTAVSRIGYALRGKPTRRPGPAPAELADLTRLALVRFGGGSVVLELALAERIRPFDELDLGVEAVDCLGEGLAALAAGDALPEPWDAGVLEAIEGLTRVFERGVDEVAVDELDAHAPRRARLTREARERVTRELAAPEARTRMEVEGRLLMADFAAGRDQARIHPPLDPSVKCIFPSELESKVVGLLRRYVRASGEAELDETGRVRVLRLDRIEAVEPAPGLRSFWERPTLDELAEEQGVQPLARLEDAAADFWPEDESVDDFLAAIESGA